MHRHQRLYKLTYIVFVDTQTYPAVSPSATQLPNMTALCGHARKLNPALYDCCRIISGCLKPTNLNSVDLQLGRYRPSSHRKDCCLPHGTHTTDMQTPDMHQLTCRASLRQNGTGGGRVFAGWIWRGLAVLASLEVNRLRARLVRSKTVMRRWGYLDDAQSVDCDCGEPQTMGISCHAVY